MNSWVIVPVVNNSDRMFETLDVQSKTANMWECFKESIVVMKTAPSFFFRWSYTITMLYKLWPVQSFQIYNNNDKKRWMSVFNFLATESSEKTSGPLCPTFFFFLTPSSSNFFFFFLSTVMQYTVTSNSWNVCLTDNVTGHILDLSACG